MIWVVVRLEQQLYRRRADWWEPARGAARAARGKDGGVQLEPRGLLVVQRPAQVFTSLHCGLGFIGVYDAVARSPHCRR